jgi:hypothetical protein
MGVLFPMQEMPESVVQGFLIDRYFFLYIFIGLYPEGQEDSHEGTALPLAGGFISSPAV